MRLGYINADRDELSNVVRALRMLSEPGAIDELGIGRIRDAFSDMMFPGTSTLQKHLKYFSLMPQLYRKAAERKYNRPSEVEGEIVRLERIMTNNLFKGSKDKEGITGSSMVDKPNFVKYDPTYIYNSGLNTFGILRSTQIYELIYSASTSLHNTPKRMKTEDENLADDAAEHGGLFQFCSFPNVKYDFTKECSLDLTPEDKEFIRDHILRCEKCKGTLLWHIVKNPALPLNDGFPGVPAGVLPENLENIQDLAVQFADFIYPIHLFYNWIYSKKTDNKMLEEFESVLGKAQEVDIEKVLKVIDIKEASPKYFCRDIALLIAKNDMKGLEERICEREKNVKGSRRKLGTDNYNPSQPVHHYKLSYRWKTVKTFADELRKDVNHG